MNETFRLSVEKMRHELLAHLRQAREKPYLPVWGELYCTLRGIRSTAQETGENVLLYRLTPMGTLSYSVQTDTFVAEVPELHLCVSLSLTECADALAAGRFSPEEPSSEPSSASSNPVLQC